MSFKEIKEKLINGDSYYKLLEQKDGDLYSRIYSLIESNSEIEDSPELAEVIGAVTEALGGIQAEALEIGYNAGVTDTLQELKQAGLTEFDLTSYDLTNLEFTEADKKEFEKLEKELEDLDTSEFFKDIKDIEFL